MENDIEDKKEINLHREGMVHFILSHSYTMFLFAVVLGLIFDITFSVSIFHERTYQYLGLTMIIIGSIIIYWAQSTSSITKKQMVVKGTPRNFAVGPYKYSRNPTHIGLTIMVLGLAFVLNSLFSVIFVVIASLITKFIFVKQEEVLLEEKYGQDYIDYKNKVRTWV